MVIHVQTDLLIIGTGGAGLRAAIEAESMGAKAVLVSKAPAGHNNTTIVAGSGYLAAVGGMTIDEHRDRTFTAGKMVNDPELVETLVQEGGERVLELSKYGCVVNERFGGINVGAPETILGQGITLPQVKYLKDRGVEFVENVIITKLIKDGDRVVGAVGYSSKEMDVVLFQAKAVLLASGGAGALFKRTDCPLKTTGDGYSLAFNAGARLRDMEYCQFFPLALAEPDAPPLLVDGPVVWLGKIINILGEDIPAKHNVTARPYIAKSRDTLSRAMMMEILLDAREVILNADSAEFLGMVSLDYYKEKLRAHERPFRIAPISHFSMGGVVANRDGETGVEGLFVAGEVMGGIHGANRHGGNALTDVTVFGARAAKKALEYSVDKELVDIDELSSDEAERIDELSKRETGFTPAFVMSLLRENMWENVGVLRDADMLVEAYKKLSELRDSSRLLLAQHGKQILAALELEMALDASEFIIRAAMERKESRGAHYRLDYPEEREEWMKTVIHAKIGEAY